MTYEEPDITADKVYFPEDKTIRVHLSLVTPCPTELPPGFYWYGTKRNSWGVLPSGYDAFLTKNQRQKSPWTEMGNLNLNMNLKLDPSLNV